MRFAFLFIMNLNKVFIIGNLTRDVELRMLPSGQPVANFGMATNRFYTDKNGVQQKEAEFHNIVVWGKQAQLCNQYLAKGRLAMIEGRLRTRSWQDQNNQTKWRTEIIADRVQFGPRGQGGAPGEFNAGPGAAQNQRPSTPPQQTQEEIPEINLDEEIAPTEEIPF